MEKSFKLTERKMSREALILRTKPQIKREIIYEDQEFDFNNIQVEKEISWWKSIFKR